MNILLCVSLWHAVSLCALEQESVRVCVPADVLKDYKLFIGTRDPLQIKNFKGEGTRRDVVEMILIQQAFALGGKNVQFEFVAINSYARILEQLQKGQILMAVNSMWLRDLNKYEEKLYISDPLIKSGDFVAGCYVLKGNKKALQAKSLKDIRELRVISNKAWTNDWETLRAMGIKELQSTAQWSSMVKMLGANRADMLLAPFQATEDFSLVHDGITLIPIPQIKVALQGSRHCALSRLYPNSADYFQALNKGLAQLHKDGTVQRAYEDAGFFNKRVKSWRQINPAEHKSALDEE